MVLLVVLVRYCYSNKDSGCPHQSSVQDSNTAQKMKFSIKDFFSKCDQITEEILNGKLQFLCSVRIVLIVPEFSNLRVVSNGYGWFQVTYCFSGTIFPVLSLRFRMVCAKSEDILAIG